MEIDNIPGVYAIVNTVNGKKYIGSSFDVKDRLIGHKSALRHNRHQNSHLQRAWNKYGEDAFTYELLESCLIDELLDLEQKWIDDTEVIAEGYNICPVSHSTLGRKLTEEHKEKIRQTNLGHPVTDDMREKFKENYASNHKIKDYLKNKKGDREYWESIGFSMKGKKHSDETKRKISEAKKGKPGWNKGKPIHENTRAALIKANTGSKHSDEHKRKISEGNTGIIRAGKLSESDVEKIRELYQSDKHNQREISKLFDVTQGAISRIVNNVSWNNYKKIIRCQ